MIAVIKGDIVNSRAIEKAEQWLAPLKQLFSSWGNTPEHWEFIWGDSFQLEISHPEYAFLKASLIKAVIKQVVDAGESKLRASKIDVRMSIGIGMKSYTSTRISESNGTAFTNAGDQFEQLKRERTNLLLKSPWSEFDEMMNLYFRLMNLIADNWTIHAAELVEIVLKNPDKKQKDIAKDLGISQGSVSSRWDTAKLNEILRVDEMYRSQFKKLNS